MRILFLHAYDQPSGHSNRTFLFAKYFSSLGHEVIYVTNNYCYLSHTNRVDTSGVFTHQIIDNVSVYWLNVRPYTSTLGRGFNILDTIARTTYLCLTTSIKPDYIISPSVPLPLGFFGLFLSRLLCAKHVYEIRDVWPYALASLGVIAYNSTLYKMLSFMEKVLYIKSSTIISTLPAVSQHITNLTKTNLAYKTHYIPNPFSFDATFLDCINKKNSYPKSTLNRVINLVYIGGFGMGHDIDLILRAATALFESKQLNFYFTLYGAGPKHAAACDFIDTHKLSNISIHPPIPKSKIPSALASADLALACCTSSDSFRFGINLNKLVSYFACSMPVLYSGNAPNNPVRDAAAGFTCPASDLNSFLRCLQLFASSTLSERNSMSSNAYNYARSTYSISTLGNRYLQAMCD